MKTTRLLSAILFWLILSSTLTGCLASYAEETSAPVDDDLKITSDAIDVLALVGLGGESVGNHGAHQTRVVSVSSGTYIGVSVNPSIQYDSDNGERYMAVLLRVNHDGSVEKLYTEYTLSGSTTVCLMADKNEDVWMWCGWSEGTADELQLKLWHYDVSENIVNSYETIQKVGEMRYGSSLIDAENEKIYAIMNGGGGIGGIMLWCEFDMKTKEWQKAVALDIDYRICYHYSFPDGNGGFVTVAERDVMGPSVASNVPGLSVGDAIKQLRSRWLESDGLWDELYLLHIEDPTVAEAKLITVEEATYDVENGVYPRVLNVYNDVLLDANGNLHVLYTMEDDGVAGIQRRHKIYDVSDNMKLLYEGDTVALYGKTVNYSNRFFEDAAGNVYILASCEHASSQVEVWKATDELNSQFKLVHIEALNGMGQTLGMNAFIIGNRRSNSTTSNIASVIVPNNDTWYAFSIDLSNFAN